QPDAHDLSRLGHHGRQVEPGELVASSALRGHVPPVRLRQQRTDIGRGQLHGFVAVHANCPGPPIETCGGQLHYFPSSTNTLAWLSRSKIGWSENRNRSKPPSERSDHLDHDGTTIKSPFSTRCSVPSTTISPVPSNTCHTEEPTSRRGRVHAPARNRWNSARIVDITSPPVVGLV